MKKSLGRMENRFFTHKESEFAFGNLQVRRRFFVKPFDLLSLTFRREIVGNKQFLSEIQSYLKKEMNVQLRQSAHHNDFVTISPFDGRKVWSHDGKLRSAGNDITQIYFWENADEGKIPCDWSQSSEISKLVDSKFGLTFDLRSAISYIEPMAYDSISAWGENLLYTIAGFEGIVENEFVELPESDFLKESGFKCVSKIRESLDKEVVRTYESRIPGLGSVKVSNRKANHIICHSSESFGYEFTKVEVTDGILMKSPTLYRDLVSSLRTHPYFFKFRSISVSPDGEED